MASAAHLIIIASLMMQITEKMFLVGQQAMHLIFIKQ